MNGEMRRIIENISPRLLIWVLEFREKQEIKIMSSSNTVSV